MKQKQEDNNFEGVSDAVPAPKIDFGFGPGFLPGFLPGF